MGASFVSSAGAEADSITIPSHQANDIIVLMAYRTTGGASISFFAGWDQLGGNNTAVTRRSVIAAKHAASSSETSGTWTNATHLAVCVFRPTSSKFLIAMNFNNASTNNSTTQNNPALTCRKTSKIVRLSAFDPTGATGYSPQADFTSRLISNHTDADLRIDDSDTDLSSIASYTNTMSDAVRSHSYAIEIMETDFDIGGGGSAFQLVGGGGLVY